MADILVRDVPEAVKRDLKRRAARRGKSLTAELREAMIQLAHEERDLRKSEKAKSEKGLGTLLMEIFAGKVPDDFEIPDFRSEPIRTVKFDE